jgi:hypothetical protein
MACPLPYPHTIGRFDYGNCASRGKRGAEGAGFEPANPFGRPDFKSGGVPGSPTPPMRLGKNERGKLPTDLFAWCQGAESNRGHPDFQSGALPLSYPGISFAALNYSTQKAGVKHFRRDSKIAEVAKTWAERLGKVSGWHQTFGAGGGNCAGV